MGTINIVVAVDVIAALSNQSLEGSLHMMDDGPWPGENQATSHLITYCWPGWQINWVIQQVDLQTPAVIRSIRFKSPGGDENIAGRRSGPNDAGTATVWSGIVPFGLIPGYRYQYEIEVAMARGINSILSVETPALVVPPALRLLN
jgi:hypothetical protein